MTTKKTANPRPSPERKKSKVAFLMKVFDRIGTFIRVCNLIDRHWDWIKEHWKVVCDSVGFFQ